MIRPTAIELNGLRVGSNADSLVVDYVYPGTIDIHIVHGITLKTTGDAKNVRLGRLLAERTAESVMDDRSWQWEPSAAATARAWVQHVLVADSLEQSQSYEFEGQVVLVGHRLPPRAAEVSLYAAGFRPSLGTWRAPATEERRVRLPELVRALGGNAAASAAQLTVPPGELKERAQHVWMRWHAIFRTALEVGGRTYQVRGRPMLRDNELEVELRHASSKSELTLRFDVSTHPLLFGATVELGDSSLRRELLAWEDLPALAEEIGAAVTAQKKGGQIPATAATAEEARPHGGAEALKQLARRLRALLTGSVRIGGYRYHSPLGEIVADHVEVAFNSDGPQRLTLYVAPRQEREVDLRGELTSEDGDTVARFDWTAIQLSELIAMKETSFARWFGMPVLPERKLPPNMRKALAILRAEEDAQPWEPHSWPGVHDATKDALIARGLVVVLESKHGGFPHYKTTPAGRAVLFDEEPAPPAADRTDAHASDKPYEEARSAIKALGLSASKYARYLRQAETAIADGKSYLPVVARARKAAEKLKAPPPATGTQALRSELAAMLDSFNAEPGYRLASQRQRGNSHTFVVYPEGKDIDDVVAAIDVVGYEIDAVRWIDSRVSRLDQDAILERMDRALWAASDVDNDIDTRSPLQDLTEMMERLVRARGVDVEASRNPARADGYPGIAEALAELAEPAEMDALQFEVWLESTGALMKAAEVVASARGSDIRVPDLMRRLWREILIAVPIATVSAGPTPGTLRVPDNALRRNAPVTVLERRVRHGRATLREVVVSVRGKDPAPGWSIVADPTDRLEPGTAVHDTNYPDVWLHQIYRNVNAFEDHLVEAPKRLADVRTLLYWTAAMLDAPLCQGDVKRRAAEALQQAKTYYEAARRQLIEGQTVDAARRIHEALRRISAAAAELARSCGDGQTTLPGAAPTLEVTEADKAALAAARPTTPIDPSAPRAAMHPSAMATPAAMGLVSAPNSDRGSLEAPAYYIFRAASGHPELLTRDAIEAKAREAVGEAVHDDALLESMSGSDIFASCVSTVEALLDAKFEGHADPTWAASILQDRKSQEEA